MFNRLFRNKEAMLIDEYHKAAASGNKTAALYLIRRVVEENPGNKAARGAMGRLSQEIIQQETYSQYPSPGQKS